jgi:hypothetical protein
MLRNIALLFPVCILAYHKMPGVCSNKLISHAPDFSTAVTFRKEKVAQRALSSVSACLMSEILKVARAANVRVFFTRHMSLPKELMGAFQFRMAMSWQRVDDPKKFSLGFYATPPALPLCQSCNRERAKPYSTNSPCPHSKAPRLLLLCAIAALQQLLSPALQWRLELSPRFATRLISASFPL